MLVAVQRET